MLEGPLCLLDMIVSVLAFDILPDRSSCPFFAGKHIFNGFIHSLALVINSSTIDSAVFQSIMIPSSRFDSLSY
jgi:hypothetical protein